MLDNLSDEILEKIKSTIETGFDKEFKNHCLSLSKHSSGSFQFVNLIKLIFTSIFTHNLIALFAASNQALSQSKQKYIFGEYLFKIFICFSVNAVQLEATVFLIQALKQAITSIYHSTTKLNFLFLIESFAKSILYKVLDLS